MTRTTTTRLSAICLGRQITFGYLANGLVSTVTDTAGNITRYGYLDRSGVSPAPPSSAFALWVLQTVTYADLTAITYCIRTPTRSTVSR